MQSLFTPGRFINAALCKALQVSEKIFAIIIQLMITINFCCFACTNPNIVLQLYIRMFINAVVIFFNVLSIRIPRVPMWRED